MPVLARVIARVCVLQSSKEPVVAVLLESARVCQRCLCVCVIVRRRLESVVMK